MTAADLLRGLYRVRALERAAGREPDAASLVVSTASALALASAPPDTLTLGAGTIGAAVLRGLAARDLARHQAGTDVEGYPAAPRLGLLDSVPSRGVSLSVASGAALAFTLRSERRVSVVVEDAVAVQSGGWHEGFSLAAARRVPLVVVLLNAGASGLVGASRRRGEAYGVHTERVVVDDAWAVARRIHRVVESARTRPTPWLVEIEGAGRDPIGRLETRVIVAEPDDATATPGRVRLDRWIAEADAEAREAWRGLEVAA